MATTAPVAHEKRFTRFGQGLARIVLGEPPLVIAWGHRHDLTDHVGVIHAAELGAEKMIGPGLVHAEPEGFVAARQDVMFDPECGNREVMDDILRGHEELDVDTGGKMNRIDLPLSTIVLDLPHELFADDVD